MGATWDAAAPHSAAIKVVQQMGLGSGYGSATAMPMADGTTRTASKFERLKWPGNKRAVLTKLSVTGAGTYTAGGDAITGGAATFGMREIQYGMILAVPTANALPSVDGQAGSGIPVIDCTTTSAPKVAILDDGVDGTAGTTLTGDFFHAILVGV